MVNFNNLSTAELITELQCILDVEPCRNGVRGLTCDEIQAVMKHLEQQADLVDILEHELQEAQKEIEELELELKELD